MQQKTTEELLDIWNCNDRGQWSDSAFTAISQTLSERGVVVPQQRVFVPPPPPARNKLGIGLFFIFIAVVLSKVLSTLTFGGVFPADQGRKTYEAVAAVWGNEYAARLAANRAAALYAAVYLFIMLIYFSAAKLMRVMRERREERRGIVTR
jgi:hypothetical protein